MRSPQVRHHRRLNHFRLLAIPASAVVLAATLTAVGQNATLRALGVLPANSLSSEAHAVSADGNVVVGESLGVFSGQAFRWTAQSGMQGLGAFQSPGGAGSAALGTSADGSVVVGRSSRNFDSSVPFRWTGNSGMIGLGLIPGNVLAGEAASVSADGGVMVGRVNVGGVAVPTRWNGEGYITPLRLPPLPQGYTPGGEAVGVAGSGWPATGWANFSSPTGVRHAAALWTSADVVTPLDPPGTATEDALAISGDGSTVVGVRYAIGGSQAFRWTAPGGLVALGPVPGDRIDPQARAVSSDGRVIVGAAVNGFNQVATIWTAQAGIRDLQVVLAEQGANTTGWALIRANGISADGRVVVGWGRTPAGRMEGFMARLGTLCAADTNGDGVLNVGDLLAYLNSYGAADPRADFNHDGRVNVQDFLVFLAAYAAGCP